MSSNSLGILFRITTWGESHGKAIGVVIDGCPAGLELSEEDFLHDMKRRAPGSSHTSPRKEPDVVEILSGVFEGSTTGAPISLVIYNQDVDSSYYDAVRHLVRPGHAQKSYLAKYKVFDHRGSGRASGRETACRVAAGVVAKKFIAVSGISCKARVIQVGRVCNTEPDWRDSRPIIEEIERVRVAGDSIGGMIEFEITGVLPGLGDPVYEKLSGNLAKAMLTIPSTKGYAIDQGFAAVEMEGSDHNRKEASLLGGIATGLPIRGTVAFKPTASIRKAQLTTTLDGEVVIFEEPLHARHDPCIALRGEVVVEAMAALVLADALLLHRSATI